jgi:hypothetical protein
MMVIITLLAFESTNGQTYQNKRSIDSIGIPISKKSFDSLVVTCTSLLKTKTDAIGKDDFIPMIRLYNSITELNLPGKKYDQFIGLFAPGYIGKAAKAINAKISRGMCYYSKELDLYIGGTRPYQNSMFKIEN